MRWNTGYHSIRLVESAGGSVRLVEQQGSTKIPGYPTWPMAKLLGYIPVVGIALGPCAGLGALKAACAHLSIMVKGTSQVFAGGPPVVQRGMGSTVDKEALGGSELHTRVSGAIDNEAENEDHAFEMARKFLSYLPSSVFELPPRGDTSDDPYRAEEALLSIIPRERRQVYRIRKVLEAVLDKGSLFEIQPMYGRSVVACLARLNGYPVGVMANDAYHHGGGLNRPAAEKMESFIDFCDTFHLPIINFVDQPGTVVGIEGERMGNVRGSVRVVSAIEQSRVPWCAIVIRRLFGLAGTAYARLQGINLHYAWPSARGAPSPSRAASRQLIGGNSTRYLKSSEPSACWNSKKNMNNSSRHFSALNVFVFQTSSTPGKRARAFATGSRMLTAFCRSNLDPLAARCASNGDADCRSSPSPVGHHAQPVSLAAGRTVP